VTGQAIAIERWSRGDSLVSAATIVKSCLVMKPSPPLSIITHEILKDGSMTRGQVSLDCVYQQAYQFIRVHRDANFVHALPRVYIKFSHLETVLCTSGKVQAVPTI
jgi:hypothetical protein